MVRTKGDNGDTVPPHMTVEVYSRKEERGRKRFGNKDLRALMIKELTRAYIETITEE